MNTSRTVSAVNKRNDQGAVASAVLPSTTFMTDVAFGQQLEPLGGSHCALPPESASFMERLRSCALQLSRFGTSHGASEAWYPCSLPLRHHSPGVRRAALRERQRKLPSSGDRLGGEVLNIETLAATSAHRWTLPEGPQSSIRKCGSAG